MGAFFFEQIWRKITCGMTAIIDPAPFLLTPRSPMCTLLGSRGRWRTSKEIDAMPAALIDVARLKIRKDLPAHRQVAAYLKAVIALGQISPGDLLPSVTTLASQIHAPSAEPISPALPLS